MASPYPARKSRVKYEQRATERKRRWSLIASLVSISVALGGALSIFFNVNEQRLQTNYASQSVSVSNEASRKAVQAEISRMSLDVERLRASSLALQESLTRALAKGAKVQIGGLNPEERNTLNQTATIAGQLDKRMLALETALSQSPEKAVAVPLLRQQLVDLQDRSRGDVDGVRGEINRLYTMLQWVLGLMMTIIIGVGGLIANSLRQVGERKGDSGSSEKEMTKLVRKEGSEAGEPVKL